MDYKKAARQVYDSIGGKENIVSAAHCATRLRLVIADNGKCSKEAVEDIDGVKGVFFASGQLQIIFGTGTVNKVYDEFIKIAEIGVSSKEEVKQAASAKTSIWKRAKRPKSQSRRADRGKDTGGHIAGRDISEPGRNCIYDKILSGRQSKQPVHRRGCEKGSHVGNERKELTGYGPAGKNRRSFIIGRKVLTLWLKKTQ